MLLHARFQRTIQDLQGENNKKMKKQDFKHLKKAIAYLKITDSLIGTHRKEIYLNFLYAWAELVKYLNRHPKEGGRVIEGLLFSGIDWSLLVLVGLALKRSGFEVEANNWKGIIHE